MSRKISVKNTTKSVLKLFSVKTPIRIVTLCYNIRRGAPLGAPFADISDLEKPTLRKKVT